MFENKTKYQVWDAYKAFYSMADDITIDIDENRTKTLKELLNEVSIDVIYVSKCRKVYYWTGTYYLSGLETLPPRHIRIRLNRDSGVYHENCKYPDPYSGFFAGLGHEIYHHIERTYLNPEYASHIEADKMADWFREIYLSPLEYSDKGWELAEFKEHVKGEYTEDTERKVNRALQRILGSDKKGD